MQTLSIEPAVPFAVREAPVLVTLVGCGGTGSFLAQSLARIAAHTGAGRDQIELAFVDGDTVEPKNIGRQLFGPGDVGRNKAQTLAARFSSLFGLQIDAVPAMATAASLQAIARDAEYGRLKVLVGAVDGHAGRRAMAEALRRDAYHLWIDCGNHERGGQVAVGSTTDPDKLHKAVRMGVCNALPAPSLVYPDLLVAPKARRGCAEDLEANVQSLMINQMMAAIASEYLAQLIQHRRLETFTTTVDLATLAMRSTPITQSALRAVAEQAGAVAPAPESAAPARTRRVRPHAQQTGARP